MDSYMLKIILKTTDNLKLKSKTSFLIVQVEIRIGYVNIRY